MPVRTCLSCGKATFYQLIKLIPVACLDFELTTIPSAHVGGGSIDLGLVHNK